MNETAAPLNTARQSMEVDIACVGFGPAMGGFLTTLSRGLTNEDGTPAVESRIMPGMPPQVLCYERADDIGFGVSGVVTRGRAIRETFPDFDPSRIPMAVPVRTERLLYLLDPIGASRRSRFLRAADGALRAMKKVLPFQNDAVEMPFIPSFMKKHDGFLLSVGQFNQWVGSELMSSGTVQIWPGTPVSEPIIGDGGVEGVRLADQGTDRNGNPDAGYMPGMDVRAALTVIGDGPVGPVGRKLDARYGLPDSNAQHDWAVGMKMVVDLPRGSELEPGTVFHTFGYPEPEIFGFLYVYPDNVASLGIFVPSWFDSPVRTAYRYLQHWMTHPYLWRHLEGGTLRSWGAKTLQESGRRGEPHLAGNGYARIGEGSGSTNVLTGSGVDEAWETGRLLADGVLDLLREGKAFTKENLDEAYVRRRRASWLEKESRAAEKARDGFTRGFVRGMIGMAISGFSGGKINLPGNPLPPHKRVRSMPEYFRGRLTEGEIRTLREQCEREAKSLHDALMDRAGWPPIPMDGKLLMSHQDALLVGGKVQAPPGYADHVVFLYPNLCEACGTKLCIEICSGQALTPGEKGVPAFDREKCVHCGACIWNCMMAVDEESERTNIEFRAGAGGLHSAEN